MSLFLTLPISGQGTITDVDTARALPSVMGDPFGFTDVFMYSHGWWTSAESAMIDYNGFSIGVSRIVLGLGSEVGHPKATSLGIGVHWPAIVSEDARSILNVVQPLTFFNRARMADIVGASGAAALLRLILTAPRPAGTPPPKVHLIGHSFGCKVVCSALQALASTSLLNGVTIDAVLIQAAFDQNSLESGQAYGNVFSQIPQVRILATRSDLDIALRDAYVAAGVFNLVGGGPKQALGFAGPTPNTPNAASATQIAIDVGFSRTGAPDLSGPLVVADLTPLHEHDGVTPDDPLSGHHTDIFHDEIYQLIAAFMFSV
jgi:hypothetical protein